MALMANPAGIYTSRLRRLEGVRTKDTATGEDVLSHEEGAYYWCAIEEAPGRRETVTGRTVTGSFATIRIRNYPDIAVDDLLKDEAYDQFWHIETIYQGDNEMICDAYQDEIVLDFTLEDS